MAEKDYSGGGGIRNKVHNILMRSKYPQPEICFELDDNDRGIKWIAYARLGRFCLTADGKSKQECGLKIYEEMSQILQQQKNIFSPSLCFWGCCLASASGGDESTNPSLPPQLEKVKKKGKVEKPVKKESIKDLFKRLEKSSSSPVPNVQGKTLQNTRPVLSVSQCCLPGKQITPSSLTLRGVLDMPAPIQ